MGQELTYANDWLLEAKKEFALVTGRVGAGAQLSALDHGNLSKARNQFWGLNCRLGPGADSHECPVSGSQFMSTKAVEVQSLRLGMGPGLW